MTMGRSLEMATENTPRISADEVIANTLANWPRTVDAEKIKAELAAFGFKIIPRDPTREMQLAAANGRARCGSFEKPDDIHPVTAASLRAAWDAA